MLPRDGRWPDGDASLHGQQSEHEDPDRLAHNQPGHNPHRTDEEIASPNPFTNGGSVFSEILAGCMQRPALDRILPARQVALSGEAQDHPVFAAPAHRVKRPSTVVPEEAARISVRGQGGRGE